MLSLHVNKNSQLLVLDNLSSKVLHIDKKLREINQINFLAYKELKSRDGENLILKR